MPGPVEAAHGPMLVGTLFNTLLFGIMITQVYIYYTSYRRDKILLKLLVIAVFLVDTLNTIIDIMYIYICLIRHFGDIEYLKAANWQSTTGPALTGVNSLMVQLFFAWRIRVLTENWFLVAIVVIPSLTSGTCAFLTTWEVTVIPQFDRFQEFKSVVIVWLACSAAADITITTILVLHLQKTGFKGSDMIIDHIIHMTVQTGLITSVVATIDLTVYLANPSGLHLLFNWSLCLLYSNSLMGSLNSRGRWRRDNSMWESVFYEGRERSDNHDNTTNTWQSHELTFSEQPKDKRQSIVDSTRKGVFVHVESHEMRDLQSQEKDLHVDRKAVVIPVGVDYEAQAQKEASFLSPLRNTYDRKGSAA